MSRGRRRDDVVFVVYDGIQALDLTGPWEVFHGANDVLDERGPHRTRYRLTLCSTDGRQITSETGLRFATEPLNAAPRPHTLVIPGGFGSGVAIDDPALINGVQRLSRSAERVVTVCTGALVAAAAGLCDGKRVATHWARAASIQRRFPAVDIDVEPIYIRDGRLWSSAGVTAGIDLALAIVEDDHSAEVAQAVARWLVMFLRRPGGQTQFATPVWTERSELEPVRVACTGPRRHRPRPRPPRRRPRGARRHERAPLHALLHRADRHQSGAVRCGGAGRGPPTCTNPRKVRHCTILGARNHFPRVEVRGAMTIQVAIPLFDRFTALDGIGPYEVLQRIPKIDVTFIGHARGEVRSENGFLGVTRDATFEELPKPDIVVFPGGVGTRPLVHDERVIEWVRNAHETTMFTTSVCTGSFVLAAAGLLNGLTATTYWSVYPELAKLGAIPVADRVVEHLDHRIITAAGVSSGIDMALRLVEILYDRTAAEACQLMIEYDPQPPFDAGAVHKVGDSVIERIVEYAGKRQ